MSAERQIFDATVEGDVLIVTPLVNLSDFLFEGLLAETKHLLGKLEDPAVTHVVVDLRNTVYFGSDFIAILLKLWKIIRTRDGRMALCNLSAHEKEILRICELDRLWPISSGLDEARGAVGA